MSDDGPQDSANYYIRVRGRVTGPYEKSQLKQMISRGQLGRMHEVSADGRHWKRVQEELGGAVNIATSQSTASADDYSVSAEPTIAQPQTPTNRVPAVNSAQWYYSQDQDSVGPIPFAVIQDLIRSKVLNGETRVWNDSMENWQPAAQVFGLSALLQQNNDAVAPKPAPPGASPDDYRRVSAMAVTSLILGILWLWGFGSIMAIVFGGVSLYQIHLSRGRLAGTGLAIAGLVLGVVILGFQIFSWFYWEINMLNPRTFDNL